ELKTQKSKNNRVFLEERLAEVKLNLKNAEDSMKVFQEQSGMLNAESQIKGIFEVYTSLEAELITKQVQLSIFEKLYDKESPILNRARTELQEYETKIKEIKSKGQPQSILLSKGSIPAKTIEYLRHYRNVEINSAILEFVLPLYEQSKFEEQKDIPILQVVDYAVPAQKKSYPPRTLFALMITVFVFFTSCLVIFLREVISKSNNEKFKFIISNAFTIRKNIK
ncbi:MAG: hypothetical protein Q8Q47_06290, partial [Ignavibacteriaceae bacterium]|nr:hypothetical protein [Ignavibacteriaceae bacterium]